MDETREENACGSIVKKHSLATRWFHWLNFPLLFTMIWSGCLILWANNVFTWFGWTQVVPQSLLNRIGWHHRLAEGMAWHFFFMWLFTINGILYVLYTLCSGTWRELLPNRKSAAEAWQVMLHDLRIRKEPLPARKYNGAQQITYTAIVLMGGLSLLTGLAVYKPTQLSWLAALFGGYDAARFIHFWLTIGYVAFFLVHVLQVVRAGWNNFRAMVTGYEIADGAES